MAEPPRSPRALLTVVGPGLVVAATGVGAGDLVAAAKAGATFGLAVLWAAVAGAVVKLVLAEGVGRYQLATGETLVAGLMRRSPWPVRAYFLAYLVVWSAIVAAALMSACGLALHAVLPSVPVAAGAAMHGIGGAALVWLGRYEGFERFMKWATGLMVVALVGTALVEAPPAGALLGGLIPTVPAGGTVLIAGIVGGVGGTVTLLSYGYWIREKGWSGAGWLPAMRTDLVVAYGLTGLFGVALVMLGAAILKPAGVTVEGARAALELAGMLGARLGAAGEALFLAGFWAAVATSLVGVWQGVPYLFADALAARASTDRPPSTTSPAYRIALLAMTFPPMALLLLGRPVWLVVAYAALGSLFMPFLAAALLVLNRRLPAGLGNRALATAGLLLCLALFAFLAAVELAGLS